MDRGISGRPGRLPALVGAVVLVSACAQLSALGTVANLLEGVLGATASPDATGEIVARVEQVDPPRQHIVVETETGEWGAIAYSGETRAFDTEGREIRVGAVPVGEWARLRLRQARQGYHLVELRLLHDATQVDTLAVDTVAADTLPAPVPEPRPEVGTVRGEVGSVEVAASRFTVRPEDGESILVLLPRDAHPEARERFEALRPGDGVRVEGRWLGDARLELHRFIEPDAPDRR